MQRNLRSLYRVSPESAGYMELKDAQKDGDCEMVEVDGGISKQLGCCDLFTPENEDVQQFRCGKCKFEA